jgi:hypothetical protein
MLVPFVVAINSGGTDGYGVPEIIIDIIER